MGKAEEVSAEAPSSVTLARKPEAIGAELVNEPETARQIAILEAATGVFRRYGFKKTAMDDIARAVGISRQALYLHFRNKEVLFQATVKHTIEAMCDTARAVLARHDLELEERLLGAYEAIHGSTIDSDQLEELFSTTVALSGYAYRDIENRTLVDVSELLVNSGIAARWERLGASPEELAAQLLATSSGIRRRVSTVAAYRERMRIAVRMMCLGELRMG